jgi:lipopolysaccharide/colanic/teichoic acid biosynthesis glycosyltransferase
MSPSPMASFVQYEERFSRKESETMQRVFDFTISLILTIVLLPLMAIIALIVMLQDGGSVFYAAPRVGKEGKLFRVLKFRTMVPDAEKLGPGITASGDPRVTRFGKFLRKTKLDELPQFMNVLKGDMGLVGPRPEDPCYVAAYTEEQRKLLSVRPGITSPASLEYRDEELQLAGDGWEERYLREILPSKLSMEAAYQQKRTLLTDIGILLKTAGLVLKK